MIQPLDIKTQSFKKGLFGYKTSDVNTFVDTVYRAYEELYNEYAGLADKLEKLNKSLEEGRLKIFELENKLQKAENVSNYDDPLDVKKSRDIVAEAKKNAAEIIAKAKEESDKIVNAAKGKADTGNHFEEDKVSLKTESTQEKKSAASEFFKKAEEEAPIGGDDDDEIFVGEIEDNRKRNKMMIGDGEEDDDVDFEFL